ncbi:MAG: tRNA (adenosine(37)-N6)-dimethylallyltransferase MiaA [Pseudomonadota bacterium]
MLGAKRPIVCLMGPTACGKTDTAAFFFDQGRFELISVDAAQVYRGMDIGTAKPDRDFLKHYPHHLIDFRDPQDTYSAAEFCSDATALISQIHARGNIPLLVGGTLFYFTALMQGLSVLPESDAEMRRELQNELSARGNLRLHEELARIDPELASRIHANDPQRLIRALEIYRLTGVVPSRLMARNPQSQLLCDTLKIVLFNSDRSVLHRQISERYMRMVNDGLFEEVASILTTAPSLANSAAMRTVGYRQSLDFIEGRCSKSESVKKGIAATRQLAKRQLTWLRQQSGNVWIDTTQKDCALTAWTLSEHWLTLKLKRSL